MGKRLAALLAAGVLSAVAVGTAAADPAAPPNGHNCAGFTSAAVPPGIGPVISVLAQLAPSAVPTTFDLANCGENGNGK